MVRILEDSINVIGDSLEACLYSRYLASKPNINRIDHYTTGEYGGFYFDEVKDSAYVALFLTNAQLSKISNYIPNIEVRQVTENYVKAPSKKIKFSNPYDEYIPYPLNKASFELEMDYVDNILKTYTKEEFIIEYKEHKNITKLMKDIFSDQLYLNIVKKIGCNQWNLNQSQLDPSKLYNLLHLYQLDSDKAFEYYNPSNGISSMCKELLNDSKIVIHKENRKDIKAITKSQVNKVTYLFEYVDYYMDFMFGGFDYMKAHTDLHSKSISEYKYFRIYTPFDKDYYVYFGIDSCTYKSWNEPIAINSHDFGRNILIPSLANTRKMIDYRKVSNVNRNFKILL